MLIIIYYQACKISTLTVGTLWRPDRPKMNLLHLHYTVPSLQYTQSCILHIKHLNLKSLAPLLKGSYLPTNVGLYWCTAATLLRRFSCRHRLIWERVGTEPRIAGRKSYPPYQLCHSCSLYCKLQSTLLYTIIVVVTMNSMFNSLQCSDTVGWVTGRASGL